MLRRCGYDLPAHDQSQSADWAGVILHPTMITSRPPPNRPVLILVGGGHQPRYPSLPEILLGETIGSEGKGASVYFVIRPN